MILFLVVILFNALISLNSFKIDNYLVVGIKNNYYLATNFSSNVQIYTENLLQYGDLLAIDQKDLKEPGKTLSFYGYNSNTYFETNNIKYKTSNFNFIKHYPNISSLILKRIDEINNNEVKALYKKLIFNIQDYELLNDFISESGLNYYGISLCLNIIFDYFFNDKNKRRMINFSLLILFLINPNFAALNYLFYRLTLSITKNSYKALGIQTLIILSIFPFKAKSISFLFPALLRIFSLLKPDKVSFTSFVILLNSYFFNSVNIIKCVLFKILSLINGLFMLIGLISLVSLSLGQKIGLIINQITSLISKIDYELIGHSNLINFIFVYLLIKCLPRFKLKSLIITLFVICINLSNLFGSVSFINIGHGDSILLRAPLNRETILIDTGSQNNYYRLDDYLKGMGISKIDYLLITHSDEDHSGNIERLIAEYKIQNIITSKEDLKTKQFSFLQINKGNYLNVNANSNCYLSRINGLTYLFTGDIDKESEMNILKEYNNLNIDILKVAHHGSSTSSSNEFIQQISPMLAIISCSNKYGFPSVLTIKTLENNLTKILSTKEEGDIKIINLNKFIYIHTIDKNYYIKI